MLVWTGRPDGGARPGLTGREAALPLLFQVFDLLSGETTRADALTPQTAPAALRQVDPAQSGPQVLFPPDGAALLADGFGPTARGFALTARGEGLRWYADGQALAPGIAGGPPVWHPAGPGFYRLVVIDGRGRRATASVRVK